MSSLENLNPDAQPPPAQAVEKERVPGKPKLNVVVREATEADLEDIVSRTRQPMIIHHTLHLTLESLIRCRVTADTSCLPACFS
jgi:hypothetical protein